MGRLLPLFAVLALGACEMSQPPARGVGFGDYTLYQRQQEYMQRGPVAASPAPAPVITTAPASEPVITPAAASAPAPVAAGPSTNTTNPVEFALATSHPIGQRMYQRSGNGQNSYNARACGRYASDSLAQEAFLQAGGPQRDRHGLDPDGDGYACQWDPAAFRLARR